MITGSETNLWIIRDVKSCPKIDLQGCIIDKKEYFYWALVQTKNNKPHKYNTAVGKSESAVEWLRS